MHSPTFGKPMTTPTMSKAEKAALTILSGCPTGATVFALELQRITAAPLRSLHHKGLVHVTTDHIVSTNKKIPRYWITDAGRAAL